MSSVIMPTSGIHETAIIHPSAKIGKDVSVGPYAVIDEDTEIGDGCVIGAHVTIHPYTKIGKNCHFFPGCSIGAVPQDLKFVGEKSYTIIGDGGSFRECCTVHRACGEGNETRIGNKPVDFVADIDEALPCRLVGDRDRIKQILLNLIGNAVKFTEQGQITLSAGCLEENGKFYLRIRIADTGIGIKKQDVSKLFVSFSQLDAYQNHNKEGTGLGLAISKSLSQMMGGNIQVESEYGKGSVFTVTLLQVPVHRDGNESGETLYSESAASAPSGFRTLNSGKVLVVDDNRINLEVASLLLNSFGAETVCAESGKEAIRLIQEQDFDLIFMDHMMPGMDGVESMKRIKKLEAEKYRHIPIVVLTANATVDARRMFFDEGFDAFLAKPIELANMYEILKTYLGTAPMDINQ